MSVEEANVGAVDARGLGGIEPGGGQELEEVLERAKGGGRAQPERCSHRSGQQQVPHTGMSKGCGPDRWRCGAAHRRPVQPNQAVLVNGAGGGVGTFAVQIAAWLGGEVTGVDRADQLETVTAVGAEHMIDYTRTDFTRLGAVYDRIVEPAAGRSPRAYRRVPRAGGVCTIVGGSLRWVAAAALVGGTQIG